MSMEWRASLFVLGWSVLAAYLQAAGLNEGLRSPAFLGPLAGIAILAFLLTLVKVAVVQTAGGRAAFHSDFNWTAFVIATLMVLGALYPRLESWD